MIEIDSLIFDLDGTLWNTKGEVKTLQPGVREGLIRLAEDFPLFLVSHCDRSEVKTFIESNDLHGVFERCISGNQTNDHLSENLNVLINECRLHAPLYVGDTEQDLRAASVCGIPFIFASYGFGDINEGAVKVQNFEQLVVALTEPSV